MIDTDDIDRDYRELRDRGADVTGPPTEQPGGVFCFVEDPDDNIIGLHQADA